MIIITQRDLQPGPEDTHPNIVCDWWAPGVGEAGFSCTACSWVGTVYLAEDEAIYPEAARLLRERACLDHDHNA